MYKLCVFAGTTEGRQLVEFLRDQQAEVTVCVATEYGEALLTPGENETVCAGRLSEVQMEELFWREGFDLVLDATHPYAREVTENVCRACERTKTDYLRILRESGETGSEAMWVSDLSEAKARLEATEGNILLTTGSKELSDFASLPGFAERVYARVLPMEQSLRLCAEAGLPTSHILAMQGPFSAEMNKAMLRFTGAKYLVTKESGAAGGFAEKLEAAADCGVQAVVIGRPPQRAGKPLREAISLLCGRFGFVRKPVVTVAGIGPGLAEGMTAEVRRAIARADCLIGARRMLEGANAPGKPAFSAISPDEIVKIIRENPQYQRFAVLMSGDTGFYSGTKKLLPLLHGCEVQVQSGISSLSYLCSRLGVSYEDAVCVSLHGRSGNPCAALRRNRKVFFLVGGENGAGELCRALCDGGFSEAAVAVGQRLGYPEEHIITGTAKELSGQVFDSLSAVLVENSGEYAVVTHGLPDEAFQRGGSDTGVIPMTKREIRAAALSMLELRRDSVCWDVGAGTGSVAVEMALQADEGRVYAIERKTEAVALLEENRRKFAAENLEIVHGTAPQACENLPAPTHVFLGGSSGNLREIVELLLRKNPDVRIVATAVTLETVGELTALCDRFATTQVQSICAARARKLGGYHLMTGQNPVYLFTMQGGKNQ